jgi:hypothetical protein
MNAQHDQVMAISKVPNAICGQTLIALVLACSTRAVDTAATTSAWQGPDAGGGTTKKVVVLARGLPPPSRHALEDHLVSALGERGVRAEPSYELFPDDYPKPEDTRARALESGAEWIVVTELERLSDRRTAPGSPPIYWRDHFSQLHAWLDGVLVTDDDILFETTIWDAETGRMLWSAWTRTRNPFSTRDFAPRLTRSLAKEWTLDGVFVPHEGGGW